MDGSEFIVAMHISPHPIPILYVTIATISIFTVEVKHLDSFLKTHSFCHLLFATRLR